MQTRREFFQMLSIIPPVLFGFKRTASLEKLNNDTLLGLLKEHQLEVVRLTDEFSKRQSPLYVVNRDGTVLQVDHRQETFIATYWEARETFGR
jgi:hypothetical protein